MNALPKRDEVMSKDRETASSSGSTVYPAAAIPPTSKSTYSVLEALTAAFGIGAGVISKKVSLSQDVIRR